jgi:hypothetical protein
VPPGDRFEPIRIDETFGYCIYNPSTIIEHIQQKWLIEKEREGFTFLWYKLLNDTISDPLVSRNGYAIQLEYPLFEEIIPKALDLSISINNLETTNYHLGKRLFGILVWPPKEHVFPDYYTDIPNNLEGFLEWSRDLKIPLKEALQTFFSKNLHLLVGVPITLAIPRPQLLVGRESNLELINFLIIAGRDDAPKNGSWNTNAKIRIMSHRTPLTHQNAREISSKQADFGLGNLIFLGCGSIGSKLIFHLARSGQINMTLVDHDTLSPHNLVRHGLLCEALGKNKAKAIKDEIDGIYYADENKKIDVVEDSALNFLLSDRLKMLNRYSWLVDSTASSTILDILCQVELPQSIRCCRCEIAQMGRLGILSIEGINHNPRLDDLRMQIFDWAIENDAISDWLQRNKEKRENEIGSGLEEITIGVSCSSETMRLSDEISSMHAATFANGFRRAAEEPKLDNTGIIQLNYINEAGDVVAIVKKHVVCKVHVMQAHNNHSWQVRLSYNSINKLKELYSKYGANEIGGILIGIINLKRKIIYITRILTASDSKSRPYVFVRGTRNLPEEVEKIHNRTGRLIGYVGEWHTHPMGGPELSYQDTYTANQIRKHLDNTNLPTHVMIVTDSGLFSHIFHPKDE